MHPGAESQTENGHRIWQIDALRGTAVLGMILYHFLFGLSFFAQYPIDISHWGWELFQKSVAGTFLLLVGVSLVFKKKSMPQEKPSQLSQFLLFCNRRLPIFFAALLVSIISWIFIPELYVRFGVLHCIAVASLLAYPFVTSPSLSLSVGLAVLAASVSFTFPLLSAGNESLLWLGLMPHGFATLDYFPLFPWFGVVLLGVWLGHTIRWPEIPNRAPWLSAIGKNALLIYLIHIPVIGLIVLAATTLQHTP